MFKNFFKNFTQDIGIDLGTKNTLLYTPEKGIVINEPTVIAVNIRTDEILAVGSEAQKMLGKTPEHIQVIKPLTNGIVSDFEICEKLIKYFVNKIYQENLTISPRPRIAIGIPLDITEVEKKAVEDVSKTAGAKNIYLLEESIAAAIGANLDVLSPEATMVIDIGGGTTEIAVISLGGVVTYKTMNIAGNELDNNIIQYIREEFNILIGEQLAEQIKINTGSATTLKEQIKAEVRGRDLITGLPKEVVLTDQHIRKAMSRSLKKIIRNIKITLELTPPELVTDIYKSGIILCGGGALLRNFDKQIAEETKIPVRVADDPLTCVVHGTGKALLDNDLLNKTLVPTTYKM